MHGRVRIRVIIVHKQHTDKKEQVTRTDTPAEDREEQRARDSLWDLKQDAKWGKDIKTQKKAIRDLASIGTPALIHLEEVVLSVVPPGGDKTALPECHKQSNSTTLD